jgi:hypothetical protein
VNALLKAPKLTTHPTLSSNVKFMNFYPFVDIETVSPRPMLFITGETAHSREFSEDAYRLAGEPKELVIVPGAGHVDLYDRVNLIPWDKLTSFFTEHLKSVEAHYHGGPEYEGDGIGGDVQTPAHEPASGRSEGVSLSVARP